MPTLERELRGTAPSPDPTQQSSAFTRVVVLAGLWGPYLLAGSLIPWGPQNLQLFPCLSLPPLLHPIHRPLSALSPSVPSVLPGQLEEDRAPRPQAPSSLVPQAPGSPAPGSRRPAPIIQKVLVPRCCGPICLLGLWAPGRGFPTTSWEASVVGPKSLSLQGRCEGMRASLSKATRLGDDWAPPSSAPC